MPSIVTLKRLPVRTGSGENPWVLRQLTYTLFGRLAMQAHLPIPPTLSTSTQWSSDGAKSYMGALALEFLGHLDTPLPREIDIPACGHRQTCWKDGCICRLTDRQWPVLQAQSTEAKARNGADVADARARSASHDLSLLCERELVHEV